MAGKFVITGLHGTNLAAKDIGGTSDPYYLISFVDDAGHGSSEKPLKGQTIKKNLNPSWDGLNHSYRLPHPHGSKLKIELYDYDVVGSDDFMGQVFLALSELKSGDNVADLQLSARPNKKDEVKGSLKIFYNYTPDAPAIVYRGPAFECEGFDDKRNSQLDVWDASRKARTAEWNKLSADEKKAKIQELVDSVKADAVPAPEKFLPALAQQYLMYGPMDSIQLLYFTLREYGYDHKLAPPNPWCFYQLPIQNEEFPKWPADWNMNLKLASRGGYAMGAEFGGPQHIWNLTGSASHQLSFQELFKMVQVWNYGSDDAKAQWFFSQMDKNNSGFLELEEIMQGEADTWIHIGFLITNLVKNCMDDLRDPSTPEVTVPMMKAHREVMRATYKKHFESLVIDSVKNILALADKDGDGKLSLAEYKALRQPDAQAKLQAYINGQVVKILDFLVKEANTAERMVAPFRSIGLF